jgi:hypothetical protein
MDSRLHDLADRLKRISDEQEQLRREHPPVIPDMPEAALGVVDFLITRSGLSSDWKDPCIKGCTEAEIAEVAAAQGVTLPRSYVDFLSVMGKEAGLLRNGSMWLYPDVLRVKGFARDLLAEWNDPFALPAQAVVVMMHQGYQFAWMDSAEDPDDPPVWYWLEGSPVPDQPEWSSWFDFLTDAEATITWSLDSQKTRFEGKGEQPPGR